MKKKDTLLEKALFLLALLGLIIGKIFLESDQVRNMIEGVALLAICVGALSKFIRFRQQTNSTVNTIWIISIVIILLGSIMCFYDWGLNGIGLWGVVLFGYTWHYSFLHNHPAIK